MRRSNLSTMSTPLAAQWLRCLRASCAKRRAPQLLQSRLVLFMWIVTSNRVFSTATAVSSSPKSPSAMSLASELPQSDMQLLENSFLRMLGRQRRPPSDHQPPVVPEYMRKMFERVSATTSKWNTVELDLPGSLTGSATTVRTFSHDDKIGKHRLYEPGVRRLKFDISSIPIHEQLQAAELQLWISLDGTSSPDRKSQHVAEIPDDSSPHSDYSDVNSSEQLVSIHVIDVVRRTSLGGEPITRLLDYKTVRIPYNDDTASPTPVRVGLDVAPAVQRWIHEPTTNNGILVIVQDHRSRRRRRRRNSDLQMDQATAVPSGGLPESDWNPQLVAFTDDQQARTRPRRTAPVYPGAHKECQRHRLLVNFSELGWDTWIVAPSYYDAFYCYGDCSRFPLPVHLNATNHAIVQTLVHSSKGSWVPPPSCAPTRLTALTMLYIDEEDNVVLKNYQEMVVKSCGCR